MNNDIKTSGLIAAACAFLAPAAQGASSDTYLTLDAFAVQNEERIPERDLGFGGRIGFGNVLTQGAWGPVSLEMSVFANPIESKDDRVGHQEGVMFDLVQDFKLGGLTPYVFGGFGLVQERAGPVGGMYPAIEAGGGLKFNAFSDTAVRVGVSAQSIRNDELIADNDAFIDLRFNVGLAIPFGDAPAPAAAAPRAVDSDGDGLADNKDACPSTPASTADGCPPPAPVVQTDSDGDGVYDSQDECAGTLSGLKVDAKGCAVETESQSVVLKGVNFLPGSATLTADARRVLDGAVAALAGQKNLKVELGGYTDSQGRDAANLALSQKRAISVRQYLIDKGIEADRLTAKGYGEGSPIADNATVEGRAENRRVELKVVQ